MRGVLEWQANYLEYRVIRDHNDPGKFQSLAADVSEGSLLLTSCGQRSQTEK